MIIDLQGYIVVYRRPNPTKFQEFKIFAQGYELISDRTKMNYLLNAWGEHRIMTNDMVNKNVHFKARAPNVPFGTHQAAACKLGAT